MIGKGRINRLCEAISLAWGTGRWALRSWSRLALDATSHSDYCAQRAVSASALPQCSHVRAMTTVKYVCLLQAALLRAILPAITKFLCVDIAVQMRTSGRHRAATCTGQAATPRSRT